MLGLITIQLLNFLIGVTRMASGQSLQQVLVRDARDAGIKEEVVHQLGELGNHIAEGMFTFLHKFIDLARVNPFWGAGLGVIVVDLMTHKVDWVHWTHEEQQWVDNSDPANPVYGELLQVIHLFTPSHAGQTLQTVTLPGVLSGSASLTITGLVLSGWGIAEAGNIIGDITKFTNVGGSSQPAASLMQPSLTTWVEQGAPQDIG